MIIVAVTAGLLPVVDTVIPNFMQMWPASQTAMVMAYLITGYFIFSHYSLTGAVAYLYLSGSCFYTAGLIAMQFFSMPGVLASTQQLGSEHTASWLWSIWHGAIPIGIMLFAVSEWFRPGWYLRPSPKIKRRFGICVGALVCIALGVVLGLHKYLPPLSHNGDLSLAPWSPLMFILPVLNLAALAVLWRATRFRTVLTLWLAVALAACLCDYVLTVAGGRRLSIGWYAGRINAVISALLMLHIYLREISRLYVKTMAHARQLRAANALLELRVDERTAELVKAYKELSEQKAMLESLAMHRDRIREQERKRIAQEIHDDLGQNLLALRIEVAMMHVRTNASHPRLHQRTEIMLANLDATIKSVRAIINDLRPATLALGLVAAVEWQTEQFKRMTGIECTLVVDETQLQHELDEESTLALFRLLQESLTNIVRHAHASAVSVTLDGDHDQVRLNVVDNGVGINFDKLIKSHSFGLMGMRERIHSLGGTLHIDNGTEGGTMIAVSMPVKGTGPALDHLEPDEKKARNQEVAGQSSP